MLRHGERGQAIFETALFMPLFLLALFGVFIAVTQGALSERVQVAVRYGGALAVYQNPYITQSLYAMYASIDGQDPAHPTGYGNNTCSGTAAASTGQVALLTDPTRHAFWQPKTGTISANCDYDVGFAQRSSPGTGNFAPPYQGNNHRLYLAAQAPVAGYLSSGGGALAGQTGEQAEAFFFEQTTSTIGEDIDCGWLGLTVKESLEAGSPNVPLGYYNGTGYGPSWVGSLSAPLPSAAPFLGSLNYFGCGQTFPGQVVHLPPAS